MQSFIKAFIKAQAEIQNARLDSNNPHFKSQYASLESVLAAVKPSLNKHGIAVLQPIEERDGKQFIHTMLIHESGEKIEGFSPIITEKNTAQAFGSGVSYSRRYALVAMLAIGADDDDGNEASAPVQRPAQPQPQAVKQADKPKPTGKMESAGDYRLSFGKEKGRSLSELGAIEVSKKLAWLKEKADAKFKESQGAREFMFWADAFLRKNPVDALDAALEGNRPQDNDLAPPPEFLDEPWPD